MIEQTVSRRNFNVRHILHELLMATLKPQSNGPLYSNTVIGTQAVDGRVGCYIWYSKKGPGRAATPVSPLLAVPNVTAHPSTASVPASFYILLFISVVCVDVRHRCLS